MFLRPRDQQTRFYGEHVDYVFRTARGLCRDQEQATEVTQRVFTEVLQAWDHLAVVRNPRAWLWQVTRNQCWRMWKERRRSPVPSDIDPELPRAQWAEPPADPGEHMTQQQMREALLRAFHERLTEEEQRVFHLRYLAPEVDPATDDARTLNQIAASLDIAKITVRRRLERARDKIREALVADGFVIDTEFEGDVA